MVCSRQRGRRLWLSSNESSADGRSRGRELLGAGLRVDRLGYSLHGGQEPVSSAFHLPRRSSPSCSRRSARPGNCSCGRVEMKVLRIAKAGHGQPVDRVGGRYRKVVGAQVASRLDQKALNVSRSISKDGARGYNRNSELRRS
jgi:hypothetical protein